MSPRSILLLLVAFAGPLLEANAQMSNCDPTTYNDPCNDCVCVYTVKPKSDGTVCDDEQDGVCTPETCQAGMCMPDGDPLTCDAQCQICDDGCIADNVGSACTVEAPNQCLIYECSMNGACEGIPDEGKTCQVESPNPCLTYACTAAGTCEGTSNVGRSCTVANPQPCKTYTCDAAGGCAEGNQDDDTECDGDDICQTYSCKAGTCTGKPVPCGECKECVPNSDNTAYTCEDTPFEPCSPANAPDGTTCRCTGGEDPTCSTCLSPCPPEKGCVQADGTCTCAAADPKDQDRFCVEVKSSSGSVSNTCGDQTCSAVCNKACKTEYDPDTYPFVVEYPANNCGQARGCQCKGQTPTLGSKFTGPCCLCTSCADGQVVGP